MFSSGAFYLVFIDIYLNILSQLSAEHCLSYLCTHIYKVEGDGEVAFVSNLQSHSDPLNLSSFGFTFGFTLGFTFGFSFFGNSLFSLQFLVTVRNYRLLLKSHQLQI